MVADQWMLEPDEQPIAAIEREVFEETNIRARVSRLIHTWTSPRITYPNGDQAQYLTVAFRCEYVSGEPRVNDDESLAVRFFSPTDLPPPCAKTWSDALRWRECFSVRSIIQFNFNEGDAHATMDDSDGDGGRDFGLFNDIKTNDS